MDKKEIPNDMEVKMISAVAHALSYKKSHPKAEEEEIMKQVSKFVKSEKNNLNKLGMIAASSKSIKILQESSYLTDREIIKKVMSQLDDIIEKVDK